MGATQRLGEALQQLSGQQVTFEQATVTGASPLTVEGADGDVELSALGWYDPAEGDLVLVARWGTTGVILGPTTPNQTPPGTGTVTAFVSGSATVSVACGGQAYTLPKLASYAAPAAGDQVAILWSQAADRSWQGVAVGAIGATPAAQAPRKVTVVQPAAPKPVVKPAATSGRSVIQAAQSGTRRGGAWRTDTPKLVMGTWNGKTNIAAWLYGGGFRAHRGKTVTAARIWLPGATGGSYAATPLTMRLASDATKGGDPTWVGNSFTGPSLADNQRGWFTLPASVAQSLVDGTASSLWLVDTSTTNYTSLLGLASSDGIPRDANSGAIEITWTMG